MAAWAGLDEIHRQCSVAKSVAKNLEETRTKTCPTVGRGAVGLLVIGMTTETHSLF